MIFCILTGIAHVHDKRQVWSNATVSDAILVDWPRLRKMQKRDRQQSDKQQCLCKVAAGLFFVACCYCVASQS